jgi:hypothetical protein
MKCWILGPHNRDWVLSSGMKTKYVVRHKSTDVPQERSVHLQGRKVNQARNQ